MTARKKAADEQPAVDETVDETSTEDVQPSVPSEDEVLVDGEAKPIVRDPSEVDPYGKTEREVLDELAGAEPVDIARHSYPDALPLPVDDTPPAAVYVDDPGKAVTTADVAALQGVQVAPDPSLSRVVAQGEVPFLSEGMRNDLEIHGHAIDPATGRVVVANTPDEA